MTLCLLLLLKRIVSRFRCVDNYCKRCGRRTQAFTVSDDLFDLIIPAGEEVCFRCFDAAAHKAGFYAVWRVSQG